MKIIFDQITLSHCSHEKKKIRKKFEFLVRLENEIVEYCYHLIFNYHFF